MKELLTAIKTQLQTDLTYVRDSDFFITPHKNFIPPRVKMPCVGIKDGPVKRTELPGGMWEVTSSVAIIPYVDLMKDEETSIMGDSATDQKGVLDIVDDIHTSLDENLLGITGMQEAFSPREDESELAGSEKESMQRKVVYYQYVKEEERP